MFDLGSKLGITTVKLEEPEPTISCTHMVSILSLFNLKDSVSIHSLEWLIYPKMLFMFCVTLKKHGKM